MTSLLELFCDVDDFCKEFKPEIDKKMLMSGERRRNRERSMTVSEMMTILIAFHQSSYRNFKAFYCLHVSQYWRGEFPSLLSYNRFVQLMPSVGIYLAVYVKTRCFGNCTGVSFIDSTSLVVCENPRIHCHKVFAGLAERGKSSTGWFFGFKLHLVVNEKGEILNIKLTPGNVDDRKPVPDLLKDFFGCVYGDKGYISGSLTAYLLVEHGIRFITKLKSNMKNRIMLYLDRIMLRRRAIIETIIDQLKNISQIEHSRHRSLNNFIINVLCGVIAYCLRPVKPSLGIEHLLAVNA
jgi:hypothetical protein